MIKATSIFDEKSLKLGSALHMRNRHPVFLVIRYLYLLFIPLGAFLLWKGDEMFGYIFLMAGPILFIRKFFWQYRLIQGAKSSPQAGEKLHWTFTDEGIHQTSKFHDVDLKWGSFCDRYLSPKAILLYPQKNQYLILPKESFSKLEDFEKVSRLIGDKVSSLR
jgi:hypothetical protein